MQTVSLKKYFESDRRLEKLFISAKAIYNSKNLPQHNINHIAHVLYRALLIMAHDHVDCNFAILISACILHDIGYCIIPKKEGHEEVGVDISTKLLKEAGFTKEEIAKIIEVIVERRIPGKSLEADILYDTDVLGQAGYGSMYAFFVSLYEYKQFLDGNDSKYRLDNFLKSRRTIVDKLKKDGLRTRYGKELLKNGFEERKEFIEKALKGIEERLDFQITIEDLF
jgi:HD superfamily phosphodiesterase